MRDLKKRVAETVLLHINGGDAQCTSEELEADTLPGGLNVDGGQKCVDNGSDLERDILLAFQQEDLSADAPSSPLPPLPSPEPTDEQMDQQQDYSGASCGGLEGPRHGSPLRIQYHKQPGDKNEPEEEPIPLDQQSQETVVHEVDGVEKQPHQDKSDDSGSNTHPLNAAVPATT